MVESVPLVTPPAEGGITGRRHIGRKRGRGHLVAVVLGRTGTVVTALSVLSNVSRNTRRTITSIVSMFSRLS